MPISILAGDITQAKVDAIVNAANPTMLGGGGVDGAIHRAAGPALLEACRKVKSVNGIRCPVGNARITEAGELPARYVIHTVGPIYRRDAQPEQHLKSAYRNSIELAIKHACRSIAFPAISCGAYGYPLEEAAMIALQVCAHPAFTEIDIRFYLIGDDTVNIWQTCLNNLSRS